MKKFSVVGTARFDADLLNIFDYIAADNPVKAVEFTSLIKKRLGGLSEFPQQGADIGKYRKLIIENYVAHYKIDESKNRVILCRIVHGAKIV
ncbi:MAG: type II toxin-antitoxin system RelE/ParE family toxin [Clostridiales bacterium]|nr:type II toxin-antitoxin system RelE/ParE family toxin [Clostridiales bacterium]